MAGRPGLQGIAVPEQYGGAGYGPVEPGIVAARLRNLGAAVLIGRWSAPRSVTSTLVRYHDRYE